MIDPRFHPGTGPLPFSELAARAGHSEVVTAAGAAVSIETVGDLAEAVAGALSFITKPKYRDALAQSAASIVLCPEKFDHRAPQGVTLVPCADPQDVFIDMMEILFPDATRRLARAAARPSARNDFRCENDVAIGTGAAIGEGVEIGAGTTIGPGAVIGPGVAIGRNCVVGARCVVEAAYLGNSVVLQPGVVVGTEGFGFKLGRDGHKKIPQLGRVIIQDGVEIGANTTIDRGMLSDTVIGEGTKIDNLVQIGHNCKIGRNCVISGMCGLSGSTVLEDGVVMGGGVGIAGHLTLGAGTTVLARTGVTHGFPPGSTIAGAPAQDIKSWKKEFAAIRRLAKGDKA